jgi:hypothetical protein
MSALSGKIAIVTGGSRELAPLSPLGWPPMVPPLP